MIKYSIEKHHNLWSVWKIIEEHGIGFKAIYTPLKENTKKACEQWCKEKGIKIGKYKKSSSQKKSRTEKEI